MKALESSDRISAARTSARPGLFKIALREPIDDPRWQLALRIAASPSLGRSRLLANFLLHVIHCQIHDRSDEITEQQIGVRVFGRPEGYDTNEDNIVRSYARNLRKHIEEYFAGEGAEEDLLLEIPRGGYTPIFSRRSSTTIEEIPISPKVHPIHLHRRPMYSQIGKLQRMKVSRNHPRSVPRKACGRTFLQLLPQE